MSCLYEIVEREGRILDRLTNQETGFRIEISRLGAEPVSLARQNPAGEWIGFLHRDGLLSPASSGWNNHATVMGFFLHRLKGGESVYRGQKITGGTHSFLRHKMFRAPSVSADSLTYEMTPEGYTSEEYPFAVSLKLTYHIVEEALGVDFLFENHESCNSAHVSFGLHPGFAVQSLEEARILLPPGRYIRHFAPGNFLSGEQEAFEFPGGEMPFPKSELPGSFLLELADVPDRTFRVEDPATGRRVAVECQEAPYLTLWSDGGPFICVEPCWGLPDHENQRLFEEKLGIQEIPPEGQLHKGFSIRALV